MASVGLDAANWPTFVFGDGAPVGHEVVSAQGGVARANQAGLLRQAAATLLASHDIEDIGTVQAIEGNFVASAPGLQPASVEPAHIVRWVAEATTPDLLDFCYWSDTRYQQQQAALSAAMEELQDDARSRVDRLIEIGLFPHIARGLLTKTIDEIGRFCALDSFESGGMHARGYCEFEPPVFIGIANLFNDPSTFTGVGLQIKRTTMHEDVHAIGAITNRGFTDYQAEQNADAVALGDWTDEVFASHAVQVSDSATPDPEIIIPGDRSLDEPQSSYYDLRELLGVIAGRGPLDIDIGLMSEAYFEPLDARGTPARREYRRRLNHNLRELLGTSHRNPLRVFSDKWSAVGPVGKGRVTAQALGAIWGALGLTYVDLSEELPTEAATIVSWRTTQER